jgi:hypothetical protein
LAPTVRLRRPALAARRRVATAAETEGGVTPKLVRIGHRAGWLIESDAREEIAAFVNAIRAEGDLRDVWTPRELQRLGITPSDERAR